jgi:hypothetical protein
MKTTSKFILILTLLSLVACGKKNPSNSAVGLVGNGRGNRSLSEFDAGNGHYLISNYILVPAVASLAQSTQTKLAVPPNVGIYVQFRLWLEHPATPTTPKIAATAVGPVKKPVIGSPTIPPTSPATPLTRNYHYFFEEYAACSDGPLGTTKTKILFDHAYLPGTVTFTRGSPMIIPEVGTVTLTSHTATAPGFATVALDKVFDTLKKSFILNIWTSNKSLETLKADHKNPVVADPAKALQDAAQACARVTGQFVKHQEPEDVTDSGPNIIQQQQPNEVLSNDLPDSKELQYKSMSPPSPSDDDEKIGSHSQENS